MSGSFPSGPTGSLARQSGFTEALPRLRLKNNRKKKIEEETVYDQ